MDSSIETVAMLGHKSTISRWTKIHVGLAFFEATELALRILWEYDRERTVQLRSLVELIVRNMLSSTLLRVLAKLLQFKILRCMRRLSEIRGF